jgi:CubicO group peptidase (beta-lactamase class C family)
MNQLHLCVFTLFLFITFYSSCTENATEPDNFRSVDWPESSPEQQGLNSQMLNLAFNEANHRPFINGIVIIRNGFLVAESYFNGYNKDDYHNIRSVSKSFLSALIGIAIRENHIPNLQTKIMGYFPEYTNDIIDDRFYQVNIHDMITMHAGIDTDHNNYGTIFYSDNWVRTTLNQALISNPGEEFHYTTAGTHILSAILTKATGMTSFEFAEEYLFKPLDISLGKWDRGPQGYYFGGNSMYTSPRNMAKFGYLYLNGGFLNNTQIVPSEWVAISVADKLNRENLTWGPLTDMGYGYLWWLGRIAGYEAFIAIGHGGQFIISIPDLQMIITTSSYSDNLSWEQADVQERAVLDVIADYVMPAVTEL